MPELPEVETIRMQLDRFLRGHKVIGVYVKNRKIFEGDEKKLFGGKVLLVRRFGKVTVIDLDNGYSIITHVKLTGQFIYKGPNLVNFGQLSKKVVGGVPGIHTHVIFELDHGGKLFYNDVRRFGWMKVVKTEKVGDFPFIKKLGPEPLRDLTKEKFTEILSKTGRSIKVVLMDQTKIGGVGNIYANDALWLAKISPKRKASSLTDDESGVLFNAIVEVLKRGIKYGGASELAFVTPDGQEGKYQEHTLVYGKEGKFCLGCKKEKIKKYFLSGRGTYFCPNCQI